MFSYDKQIDDQIVLYETGENFLFVFLPIQTRLCL
jgi:hypothetical protein